MQPNIRINRMHIDKDIYILPSTALRILYAAQGRAVLGKTFLDELGFSILDSAMNYLLGIRHHNTIEEYWGTVDALMQELDETGHDYDV